MRVAIIPARGGSKRIPRKNIRDFAGRPMIAHSIGCALSSGLFDRVIVSTDDAEIAEVARAHGAEIPFVRPAELANDHASTMDVVAHALGWLQANGAQVNTACCIYAAAPFIQQGDLRKGFSALEAGPWQYAFAATTFGYPIFRSFRSLPEGGIEMFYPEHLNTRSQDLPEALHDAGQFYWGRAQAWLDRSRILGKDSAVVMIPRWRVQDIDTPEDWDRAQLAWQILQNSGLRE